ncbi:MAG: gluconokinase [Selenomonas sp.]|nr:gluconokinase [Selenomonas sp.]
MKLNFQYRQEAVWIGIDVGTTGVRAIAYDITGRKVASSEAFYPLLTPHPDWAEENPAQIFKAVQEVVHKTAADLKYQSRHLAGLALSTVMHSFAGLDRNYQPLMDMQTWADSRSADIVRELKRDDSLCHRFYEKTGCPIHACYPLAKILWLRKNHPEMFQQMRYVGSLKDYLFYGLTGNWLIDHSTASTSGMYNEKRMDWDEEILEYVGLEKAQLPPVVSTTHSERIKSDVAAALGISSDIPVVIGATDGVLVNVGIGAVQPGKLSATIGTSGALRMLTNKPITDSKMRTWCYNLVDDMWVAGGAINNGGMILRWVRDKVCHYTKHHLENLDVDGYDLMTMKASHIAAGANGLIMLPSFTGERAPYWNSELRGMFFGLSLNHSRSHMIRACMEGIAYSMNSVMQALRDFGEIKDIRVSGSFTKSDLWMQILASVLDEELILPDNSEGAAFGAAVLGFISSHELADISATNDLVKPKRIIKPNKDDVEVYKELYLIFEQLYWKLQPELAAIAAYQKKHE